MNRLPDMLTMIEPGELRSGNPTKERLPGPRWGSRHLPLDPVRHRVFRRRRCRHPYWPSRRPSIDVDGGGCCLPHIFVVLETAGGEDHAATGPDQLWLRGFAPELSRT